MPRDHWRTDRVYGDRRQRADALMRKADTLTTQIAGYFNHEEYELADAITVVSALKPARKGDLVVTRFIRPENAEKYIAELQGVGLEARVSAPDGKYVRLEMDAEKFKQRFAKLEDLMAKIETFIVSRGGELGQLARDWQVKSETFLNVGILGSHIRPALEDESYPTRPSSPTDERRGRDDHPLIGKHQPDPRSKS